MDFGFIYLISFHHRDLDDNATTIFIVCVVLAHPLRWRMLVTTLLLVCRWERVGTLFVVAYVSTPSSSWILVLYPPRCGCWQPFRCGGVGTPSSLWSMIMLCHHHALRFGCWHPLTKLWSMLSPSPSLVCGEYWHPLSLLWSTRTHGVLLWCPLRCGVCRHTLFFAEHTQNLPGSFETYLRPGNEVSSC